MSSRWASLAKVAIYLCCYQVMNAFISLPIMVCSSLGMQLRRSSVARGRGKGRGNIDIAALCFIHNEQPCYTMNVAHNMNHKSTQSTSRYSSSKSVLESRTVTNVAIIGGGLAGLSAAYHLLDISGKDLTNDEDSRRLRITIFDKANVGEGGASSVAGGLIHPFSPRGKLIHFGLPALETSKHLIEVAAKHQPQCILRPHLYRIALSTKNVEHLQHTAQNYPEFATWMTKDEIQQQFGLEDTLGGLELGGGCKVIHVPTYLRGLWEECDQKARTIDGSIRWELIQMRSVDYEHDDAKQEIEVAKDAQIHVWKDMPSMNQHLAQYDAVILSAGAGIVHDELISKEDTLPAQLVRGQSIEMTVPSQDKQSANKEAFLCGKYVSPLPTDDANDESSLQQFVIGATHEFKSDPLSPEEVKEELKSRTHQIAKHIWVNGTIDRLTTGVRLQSHRGAFGRMPIIGRYNTNTGNSSDNGAICHDNAWIFTGLSSRGLIYHGLFGRWLANAVLCGDEETLRHDFAEFDWWQKSMAK